MPTTDYRHHCPHCEAPIGLEQRIDSIIPIIRHRAPTGCPREGGPYDRDYSAYTVAYDSGPEQTSHVNITRDTYATLANAPTMGGASLTLGSIRQLYDQINPTQEMAARIVGNNTEILHRHGVRIVNGKIASIMDVDDDEHGEGDW